MANLENDLNTFLNWFYANGMVANPNNFQFMFLGLNERHTLRLNTDGQRISSTENVQILAIETDNQLSLYKHVALRQNKQKSALLGGLSISQENRQCNCARQCLFHA